MAIIQYSTITLTPDLDTYMYDNDFQSQGGGVVP